MFRKIELNKFKLTPLSRILHQNTSRTNKVVLDARNKYKIKKDKFVEEHGGKTLKEIARESYELFKAQGDETLKHLLDLNLKKIYDNLNIIYTKLDKIGIKYTYLKCPADKRIGYYYEEDKRLKSEEFKKCVYEIDNFFKSNNNNINIKRLIINYGHNIHIIPLILVNKKDKKYIIIPYNDINYEKRFFEPFLQVTEQQNLNVIVLPEIQNDVNTCYVSSYETIKHLKEDDIKQIISYCEKEKSNMLENDDKQFQQTNSFIKNEIDKNNRIENLYNIPYDLLPPKLLQYAQTRKVFQNKDLMKKKGLKEKITPFLENIVINEATELEEIIEQNGKLGYRLGRTFDKYKEKRKKEEMRKQQQKEKNNETQKKNKLKLVLDVRGKMEQNEEKNNHSIPILSPRYKMLPRYKALPRSKILSPHSKMTSLRSKIPSLRSKILAPCYKILSPHSKMTSLRYKMHSNILSPHSKRTSLRSNMLSPHSKMTSLRSNMLSPQYKVLPRSKILFSHSNISTLSKPVNNTFQI